MKVEINYNKEKSGIELRFDAKVEGELKEQLRVAGFNYSSKYNCYWAAYAEGLMKYAMALQEALEKGESKAVVLLQPSYKPSEENLELRNYSYVTVFYLEKGERESMVENYLVFEPKKNLAWLIVEEFAKRVYGEKLRQMTVEPRNYLKNAREIFSKKFETNIIGLGMQEEIVPLKGKENILVEEAEENKIKSLTEEENIIAAGEEENKILVLKDEENKVNAQGKSYIRYLNSRGVDVPNVLIPNGIEEPFASQDFYISNMKEILKNKFSDLLEITESDLSELGPVEMFELMQFAHPTDYGIEVSRSAMLVEWEKRGEELFKQLGYPIDEDYPYVNIHTGYSSIGTLGKILDSKFSKQWWAVIQGYRPVADLQAAIVYIQEKIKEGEEERKQHLNSSTGKALGKSKDAIRDVEWKINRLAGGLEVVKEYFKKKGNPYGQIEKWVKTETEKKVAPKRKTQLSLNEEIEDFIVTKDNEGGGKYSEKDKQYIAQYTGSGGLIKQGAQGKGILYEYYTPENVVRKMWSLAYKYGYHDGKVLEPSCGTGNFLKYLPLDTTAHAYEINPTAVRIVEILYPNVKVYQRPFETIFFVGNIHLKGKYGGEKYDLIIGNPPYGDFSGKWAGMGEKQYTGATEYDQYFILRGLEMLNPGGVMVFIIPSNFLQNASKYNKVKEKISKLATLVDAYRLPTGVFNTTDIGTDIVVFKCEPHRQL